MATTAKALFRGAASTTNSTTLYTVPSLASAVVTQLVVANTSSQSATFTVALDGVLLHNAAPIEAGATAYIDLKQVLSASDIISGGASSTSVVFHISGVEIS